MVTFLLFSVVRGPQHLLSSYICSILFAISLTVPRIASGVFRPLRYFSACSRMAAWNRGSSILEPHRSWFLAVHCRFIIIKNFEFEDKISCSSGWYLK